MLNYFSIINEHLQTISECEANKINTATKMIKSCLENDKIIYVFGCGHSHMFGEELFYRAGGLANVQPILYEPLMLHKGAVQSSINEKKNNYIERFINDYPIGAGDCLIVISTSGINPVPIDVALHGVAKGANVITISSHTYREQGQSRHQDGKYLAEVGAVNIDNHVPYGDAVLKSTTTSHTPVSTVLGVSILHEVIGNAINAANNEQIPVYRSGNVSGSSEHNQKLVDKYSSKIQMLNCESEE